MQKHKIFYFILLLCIVALALIACNSGNNKEHEHIFDSWETATEATCTAEGKMLRICTECGHEETHVTEKLPHSLFSSKVEPTCDTQGYTLYSCQCGYSAKAEQVAPLGHKFTKTTIDADCVNGGYTLLECKCGYSATTDTVAPLGHTLETSVTEPTCTEQGYTHYACKHCDYEFDGDHVAPLAHKNSKLSIFHPTVKASGYTLHECNDCGHSYKDSYIAYNEIVTGAYVNNGTVLERGIDTSKHNHKDKT